MFLQKGAAQGQEVVGCKGDKTGLRDIKPLSNPQKTCSASLPVLFSPKERVSSSTDVSGAATLRVARMCYVPRTHRPGRALPRSGSLPACGAGEHPASSSGGPRNRRIVSICVRDRSCASTPAVCRRLYTSAARGSSPGPASNHRLFGRQCPSASSDGSKTPLIAQSALDWAVGTGHVSGRNSKRTLRAGRPALGTVQMFPTFGTTLGLSGRVAQHSARCRSNLAKAKPKRLNFGPNRA